MHGGGGVEKFQVSGGQREGGRHLWGEALKENLGLLPNIGSQCWPRAGPARHK